VAGARPGQITVCPPSVRPACPRDSDAPLILGPITKRGQSRCLPLLTRTRVVGGGRDHQIPRRYPRVQGTTRLPPCPRFVMGSMLVLGQYRSRYRGRRAARQGSGGCARRVAARAGGEAESTFLTDAAAEGRGSLDQESDQPHMDFVPDFRLASAQRGWIDEEPTQATGLDAQQEGSFHG
jgi:hypothetical protein